TDLRGVTVRPLEVSVRVYHRPGSGKCSCQGKPGKSPMRKFNSLLVVVLFLMGCQSDPAASRDEYMASAQEYMEKGQYQEAAIQFRNALKADSSHMEARYGLIRSFQLEGNHQAAISEIRAILKADPQNTRAQLMLGNYHLQAGSRNPQQFREAERLAEEILESEPGNLEAQILL